MRRNSRRTRSRSPSYGTVSHKGTEYKILAQGQADDLIGDTGKIRTWKSRIDGKISMEVYDSKTGRWEIQDT